VYRRTMTSMLWVRLAMVVIAVAIGVVLLVHHDVVLGVLILAMALLRVVLLVTMRNRRAAFQSKRRGSLGPPS
jgi:hypothetical protein